MVAALASAAGAVTGCASDDDTKYGGTDAAANFDGAIGADAFVRHDVSDASAQPDGGLITLDAMPVPCSVNIRSVSTPDLQNLPAGPDLFVRVRGEILGEPRPASPVWNWRVVRMAQAIATDVVGDSDPALLRVPLERPGRYIVSVSVGNGCRGEAEISAETKDRVESYVVLRLIPPQTSPLPPQEATVKISAGVATTANLTLADGKLARITPQRLSAQLGNQALLVPSFVRVSNTRSTFLREGRATGQQPFLALLGPNRHDILIVPEDNQLPPLRESQMSSDALTNHFVTLSPGVKIFGKVTHNDLPVVGARIVLRRDQQPSTIGESDAMGAYTLRARAGMHSVRIVGPPDGSWPSIEVAAGQGVAVPADGMGDLQLNVRYAPVATASLDLTVASPDGVQPAGGAVVAVSSQTQDNVATLMVGTAAGTNVAGRVSLLTATNDSGRLRVSSLPRGIYTVRVQHPPAASWPSAYETTVNVDLRQGDAVVTVKLASSVALSGKLNLLADSPADLRVVAVNEGRLSGTPEATAQVAADGSYVLQVSPNATYRLRVDPPLGRLFPRVVFGTVSTDDTSKTLPPLPLPKTLRITGRVANTAGAAVPGTLVQAFCTDVTADCIDASNPNVGLALPLSEAVVGDDGQFVLVLPDPGGG